MKIVIIGYGKMGQEIEKVAIALNHEVVSIIDNEQDWIDNADDISKADVAIEFSTPMAVVNNIKKSFSFNLPIVVGTTAWFDNFPEIKELCLQNKQSLVYSVNYSLGVNLFFELNRKLAKLMNSFKEYDVNIEEIHHITKLDSPSGTAIELANEIVEIKSNNKNSFIIEDLPINSIRESDATGTHIVSYTSNIDSIEIKHTAFNRKGLAQGALFAAEWIVKHKGVFTMRDVLGF